MKDEKSKWYIDFILEQKKLKESEQDNYYKLRDKVKQ